MYDIRNTMVYVCENCKSILGRSVNGFARIGKVKDPLYKPLFSLGTKGTIRGQEYTIVAYSERQEYGTDYYWVEYVLMRGEDRKRIFLSEFGGHYTLLEELPAGEIDTVDVSKAYQNYVYQNKRFDKWSVYSAKYHYAIGEFNWDVRFDKPMKCLEFVAPPHMIAMEYAENAREATAFYGTYIPYKEVNKAFLPGDKLPSPVGVAPAQPFSKYINPWLFLVGSAILCAVFLILQIVDNQQRVNNIVFSEGFNVESFSQQKPFVSRPFTLENKTSNMEVEIYLGGDNTWVEAEVDLVNETTGEETSFVIGTEHYSGVDEGEAWSEGHYRQKEFICNIEPGTYHFVVTPNKDQASFGTTMRLEVIWDVTSYWNAIFLSLVLLAIAIGVYIWNHSFESKRWGNSGFGHIRDASTQMPVKADYGYLLKKITNERILLVIAVVFIASLMLSNCNGYRICACKSTEKWKPGQTRGNTPRSGVGRAYFHHK